MVLVFLVLAASRQVEATEPRLDRDGERLERILEEQVDVVDTSELEAILEDLNRRMEGYLPQVTLGGILDMLRGGESAFKPRELVEGLLRYFFREVVASSKLLGELVILAIVAAFLQNLQAAFENETLGRLASTVVYLVLIALAMSGFILAMRSAREVVGGLVTFMLALIPLLITLLVGNGALLSAGLFHPLMIFITHATGIIVMDLVFPLIFFSAVLEVVSRLSESFSVSRLAVLVRQGGVAVLGLFLSIFLGVMAVQGAAASVADGVTVRTAKFLSAAFVPVVGKMFSDAVEVVIGSSLLLKNVIGVAGVAVIFLIAAFPLLKILSVVFIYRLGAALIQPLGAGKLVDCLSGLADALVMLLVATLAVVVMFFLAVTMVVGAGNAAVMLR